MAEDQKLLEKFEEKKVRFDHEKHQRPFVTLAYAQSLDGSISFVPCKPTQISSSETLRLTHQLRAQSDGILIGIGTLISDDPLLNVRLVQGRSPQPIIVDSHLRFPLNARMIQNGGLKPWVAATGDINDDTERALLQKSVRIMYLPAVENGWVDLDKLMEKLYQNGIHSVLIEGGSRIITSFIRQKLIDQIIVTVAPVIMGGFRAVGDLQIAELSDSYKLQEPDYFRIGPDLVVRADFAGNAQ